MKVLRIKTSSRRHMIQGMVVAECSATCDTCKLPVSPLHRACSPNLDIVAVMVARVASWLTFVAHLCDTKRVVHQVHTAISLPNPCRCDAVENQTDFPAVVDCSQLQNVLLVAQGSPELDHRCPSVALASPDDAGDKQTMKTGSQR